jgi:hypothetical protein
MTSEWADGLVQQRKAKEEKERIQEEARITDRKRVQENGEPKFRNVVKLVYQFGKELDEAWGSHQVTVENISQNDVKVSVNNSVATLRFVPRDQILHVSFYGGELQLSINRNDKLVWQASTESSKSWTDEEVARRTVEYAWRPGNPSSR